MSQEVEIEGVHYRIEDDGFVTRRNPFDGIWRAVFDAGRAVREVARLRAEIERLKNPPLPEGWVRMRCHLGRFVLLNGEEAIAASMDDSDGSPYTHAAWVTFDLKPVQKPPEVSGRTETTSR